ncbi:MAG: hypothetical protein ACJ72Z_09220 [Pyrinomonadaceae bacterium]
MKRYRRIEITAFQRRVQIITGDSPISRSYAEVRGAEGSERDIRINDTSNNEMIELSSAEGRRILTEAVTLLQQRLAMTDPGEKQ